MMYILEKWNTFSYIFETFLHLTYPGISITFWLSWMGQKRDLENIFEYPMCSSENSVWSITPVPTEIKKNGCLILKGDLMIEVHL